jgi:branched-chain amino acid transport system ATP-binding protein
MRAVFPELTALETALVGMGRTRRDGGAVRALTRTPRFRAEAGVAEAAALAALEWVELTERADERVASLSGAERTRVMLAAALATNPSVLLLDEPSAGASGEDVDRLARIVSRLRDDGIAVLLVEHNLRLVRAVADEVLALESGRVGPARI